MRPRRGGVQTRRRAGGHFLSGREERSTTSGFSGASGLMVVKAAISSSSAADAAAIVARLGLPAYLGAKPGAGRALLNFLARDTISFIAIHRSRGRLMVYSQPRKNLTTLPIASRQGLLCGFGL